jgi:hypothetical protein
VNKKSNLFLMRLQLNNLECYLSLNEEKSGERAVIDTSGNVASGGPVKKFQGGGGGGAIN